MITESKAERSSRLALHEPPLSAPSRSSPGNLTSKDRIIPKKGSTFVTHKLMIYKIKQAISHDKILLCIISLFSIFPFIINLTHSVVRFQRNIYFQPITLNNVPLYRNKQNVLFIADTLLAAGLDWHLRRPARTLRKEKVIKAKRPELICNVINLSYPHVSGAGGWGQGAGERLAPRDSRAHRQTLLKC